MQYRPKQSFTDEDKEDARMLLAALRNFKGLRHTMPLQYVMTYLQLVADESKSITDYAAKEGVSQSVMSRHILDLGPRNRYADGEGFQLVQTGINPMDPRNREVSLTQKGKGLYNAIRQSIAPFKRRWGK
jgi:DNA-binding MarR family transcriptional regulator